jgi:hypothetical protein
VGRKYLGQQLTLLPNHELLILQRIVPAFLDQCRNLRLFQEEFVKPGYLREHLEVGKILRLEIAFGALGGIPDTAKPLPQLPVPGVASDHIHRICLKQVLESEAAFFGVKVSRWFLRNL